MGRTEDLSNVVVVLDGHEVSLQRTADRSVPLSPPHLSDRPLNKSLMYRVREELQKPSNLAGYPQIEQIMSKAFGWWGNCFGEPWSFIKYEDLADWQTRQGFNVPSHFGFNFKVNREEYDQRYAGNFDGYSLSDEIVWEAAELSQRGAQISVATGNRFASRYQLRALFDKLWPYLNPECRVVTTPNYNYYGIDTKKSFVWLLSKLLGKKVIMAEDDPVVQVEVEDDVHCRLSPYSREKTVRIVGQYKSLFGNRLILPQEKVAGIQFDMRRGDLLKAACSI